MEPRERTTNKQAHHCSTCCWLGQHLFLESIDPSTIDRWLSEEARFLAADLGFFLFHIQLGRTINNINKDKDIVVCVCVCVCVCVLLAT